MPQVSALASWLTGETFAVTVARWLPLMVLLTSLALCLTLVTRRGVLSLAITCLVWFALAVRRLRLSTMGFLQYLAPSLQFALAVWLYREPFTRSHLLTFAFIWAGVAVFLTDSFLRYRAQPA